MWATFAELTGGAPPDGTDGISIAPTLLKRGSPGGRSASGESKGQRRHDALHWEFHSQGRSQAVRMGRWKGIRNNIAKQRDAPIELYDVERDPGETTNLGNRCHRVARRAIYRYRAAGSRSAHLTTLKLSNTPVASVLLSWLVSATPT